MTATHTIDVPGAHLYYEVRGSGPVLLLLGSPMAAAAVAPLAEALADDYTVVTHDPRGISNSRLDDPEQDSTPQLRADDDAAILNALGADSAEMFGSSGGAVTGLAVAERYPGLLRTLVAHEPPLLELLPDAAERRAETDDVIATFHREGLEAAWHMFMGAAGFEKDDEGAPEPPDEQSLQDIANGSRFFAHELRGTTRYVPDVDTLKNGASRVVVGIGAASGGLSTYRTSVALAELLGTRPVEFPGDHGGFVYQPREFAAVLRTALATANDVAER